MMSSHESGTFAGGANAPIGKAGTSVRPIKNVLVLGRTAHIVSGLRTAFDSKVRSIFTLYDLPEEPVPSNDVVQALEHSDLFLLEVSARHADRDQRFLNEARLESVPFTGLICFEPEDLDRHRDRIWTGHVKFLIVPNRDLVRTQTIVAHRSQVIDSSDLKGEVEQFDYALVVRNILEPTAH